jgi:cytochrome c-type biogenesis protein CcmH
MASVTQWNRKVKGWAGWLTMLIVLAVALTVGATRDTGPHTPADRVDSITQRVACPICDGESVFESQNNASRSIRNEVTELVRANELSDDEIIAFIETRYGADVLLVPKASGFDALIWVLPTIGFVVGVAALVLVFRRWKRDADAVGEVTDDDRALVAAALHDDEESGEDRG